MTSHGEPQPTLLCARQSRAPHLCRSAGKLGSEKSNRIARTCLLFLFECATSAPRTPARCAQAVFFLLLSSSSLVRSDQYTLIPQSQAQSQAQLAAATEMRLTYNLPRAAELLGTGLALALVYTFNAVLASSIRRHEPFARGEYTPSSFGYAGDGTSRATFGPMSHAAIAKINKLWSQVEKYRRVEAAQYNETMDRPAHVDLGSDPQRRTPLSPSPSPAATSAAQHYSFPKDFLWGVANAAQQVEGAAKEEHRGPSIWDSFAHLVSNGMLNNDTFDVATNFKHLYKLDIARVRAMGAQAFSFSISWPRIMPLGYGEVNQEGIDFYQSIVAEIIGDSQNSVRAMEAVATLFHWDLPLQLEVHYGGMTSERFVDDFVRYAHVIFSTLGKSGIQKWITFNEPQVWCLQRYKLIAPHVHGKDSVDDRFAWQCAGNLLKAHGRVYRLFKEMQANGQIDQGAQISYKNAAAFNTPFRENNQDDEVAVQRGSDFYLGLFAEPIHKTGTWPETVQREMPREWLPVLSREDIANIKGSADFFATDFYANAICKATERDGGLKACVGNRSHVAWPTCSDYQDAFPDGRSKGEQSDPLTESWLSNTAGALRPHLKRCHEQFPSTGGIYISEIGWAERGEQNKTSLSDIRNDLGRQRYYHDHLVEMLLAIYKDGTPLKGVFLWSATSNIEWELGFAPRFGLQSVNYSSPALTRTFLGSFYLVRDFFNRHSP